MNEQIDKTTDDTIQDDSINAPSPEHVNSPTLLLEAMEDVPIQLNFELGNCLISTSEFRKLGAGYSFDAKIDLRKSISITINGVSIGTGRLIQLGDNIGVQIEKWPRKMVTNAS